MGQQGNSKKLWDIAKNDKQLCYTIIENSNYCMLCFLTFDLTTTGCTSCCVKHQRRKIIRLLTGWWITSCYVKHTVTTTATTRFRGFMAQNTSVLYTYYICLLSLYVFSMFPILISPSSPTIHLSFTFMITLRSSWSPAFLSLFMASTILLFLSRAFNFASTGSAHYGTEGRSRSLFYIL